EVDGRADKNQRSAEGGVDNGVFTGSNCCIVVDDVIVDRESEVKDGKDDEDPWDEGVAGNFVGAGSIRFFSAKNEDTVSAGSVKNPANEDEGVGECVECTAEEQEDTPDALNDEAGARRMKARVRATEESREDIAVGHRKVDAGACEDSGVGGAECGK